jgi:hypothetical protein
MIHRPPAAFASAAHANQSVGWFEADDSAVSGGHTYRPACVRADRSETKTGGDGGSRSTRRPAGDPIELPRVVDGTEVANGRSGAESHFMQVLLAEQDSSRYLQPAYDLGVRGRNAIFEDCAGQSRPYASRIDVVLESERDAVEWSAPPAAPHLGVGFTRLRYGLISGHGDKSVEGGV